MAEVMYDFSGNSVVPADQVDDDGGGYVLFDEGEYRFTIIGFKRIRKENDQGKIPKGAWGAEVTFLVHDDIGRTTTIRKVFWLLQSCSWIAGKCLRACGLRKHGDPINFTHLETAKQRACEGRLILKHRKGTGKYDDKIFNELSDFVTPEEAEQAPQPTQQVQSIPVPAAMQEYNEDMF